MQETIKDALQNEVYSALLTLRYEQTIQYKGGKYYPSSFKPSKADETLYSQCREKRLISDNPLAYIIIDDDDVKDYELSFFHGLVVTNMKDKPDYVEILGAKLNQLQHYYYLYGLATEDVPLVEEICHAFEIEILAVCLDDVKVNNVKVNIVKGEESKEINKGNIFFFKSKVYNKVWLLDSLQRIKQGDLPSVTHKLFPMMRTKEERAKALFYCWSSYLHLYPHLDPYKIRVQPDGRCHFPVSNHKQGQDIKEAVNKAMEKRKMYVALAVVSCDDDSLNFCYGIRKYIHGKGYQSYLIDPIGDGKERYVVTNYDKEIKEEAVKTTKTKLTTEQLIGLYDTDEIPGMIKAKVEDSIDLTSAFQRKDDSFDVTTTIGQRKIKIPWKEKPNLWTREYFRLTKTLSYFAKDDRVEKRNL